MLPTVDQAFEARAIPNTFVWAPRARHHVVVWLFRNRYWQFEFTSLQQRVTVQGEGSFSSP
jgi:hypothetical protein